MLLSSGRSERSRSIHAAGMVNIHQSSSINRGDSSIFLFPHIPCRDHCVNFFLSRSSGIAAFRNPTKNVEKSETVSVLKVDLRGVCRLPRTSACCVQKLFFLRRSNMEDEKRNSKMYWRNCSAPWHERSQVSTQL